ncbi:putative ABC transport system permease protein [Keratinibaculum paraultunense]|uniref:Putative ABC transport system permease protein n=1 Tax=Keratinibaculum paraultunense TaxID=1278232 RepID=A0A4V2UTT5_9FIRM|nr:ABC transporter permease [Keratinibaculum paraultunense]QQY79604.1 ABC transporter permease [Keratinibaculum paraultunense]TCS87628.1 putative ABC transport system permease protein [Keratinibaculum paraultunense]
MQDFLLGVVQQSLIFSIAVMGIYISYEILKFADLSADGSFTLGASVSAILIIKGVNPFIALIFSMLAGAIAGAITGILNVKLKIQDILSSILVMVGLYSINLRVMGRANLPLFAEYNIFSKGNTLFTIIILASISVIFFTLFYKTKLGYLLKGIGDNENMIISLGINTGGIKIFALSLSNAFIALSGGILAQYQGFSDINMGTGIMIMGLASIIIGFNLFGKLKLANSSILCILGTLIYRTSIALSLKIGFNPSDLKLISSIIVIVALSLGSGKGMLKKKKILMEEKDKSISKLKKVGSENA